MEKIYRDADVDLGILKGRTIAVIGYGIQGKVQAANARDSGCTVIVGTRPPEQSASRSQAQADGFAAMSIADATKKADILLIELADPAQPAIYAADIAPHLRPGQTLCFCHGFNVLYGAIRPPQNVNTVLFVPNAPGAFVREKYKKGEGVYGCVSVEHDATGRRPRRSCWQSPRPSAPREPAWSSCRSSTRRRGTTSRSRSSTAGPSSS